MKIKPLTPDEFKKDFTYWFLKNLRENEKPEHTICKDEQVLHPKDGKEHYGENT